MAIGNIGRVGRLGLTRTTGGGWSPLALGASLRAWWTADRADLMTLSGAQVSSWRDVVGGYSAAQSVGAARPIYSPTSFGGAPGLTFDGVDDELSIEGVPVGIPTGASVSEAWIVVQQDALAADSTNRYCIAWGGTTAGTRRGVTRTVSTGVNRARALSGTGASDVNTVGSTVDFSARHMVRAEQRADVSALTVDQAATVTAAAALNGTLTTRLRIGAFVGTSASLFWNGKVRDIIITSSLSVPQAEALAKWALARRKV